PPPPTPRPLIASRRRLFREAPLLESAKLYIQANRLRFPGHAKELKFHLRKLGVPELADYLVWVPFNQLIDMRAMEGGEDGFTTVFRATVRGADPEVDAYVVVLKEFYESMVPELLTTTHLSYHAPSLSHPRLLGLTRDPSTSRYHTLHSYAPHGDLTAHLRSLPLPTPTWSAVHALALDLAAAVLALHTLHLRHGDLHPGNVLFGHPSIPMLADVGWSDAVGRLHSERGIYGHVAYFPPEAFQSGGERRSRAADVYALGVLLWFVVVGVPPRGTAAGMGAWREEFPPETPESYEEVVRGCWEVDPKKRWTAVEVCARLVEAKAGMDGAVVSEETRAWVRARREEVERTREKGVEESASRFWGWEELRRMRRPIRGVEEVVVTCDGEDDDDTDSLAPSSHYDSDLDNFRDTTNTPDYSSSTPHDETEDPRNIPKNSISFLSSEEIWPSPPPLHASSIFVPRQLHPNLPACVRDHQPPPPSSSRPNRSPPIRANHESRLEEGPILPHLSNRGPIEARSPQARARRPRVIVTETGTDRRRPASRSDTQDPMGAMTPIGEGRLCRCRRGRRRVEEGRRGQ
ncbi:kinase-like domain-containing protein, partial [Jimgerdemannia flammicorona]